MNLDILINLCAKLFCDFCSKFFNFCSFLARGQAGAKGSLLVAVQMLAVGDLVYVAISLVESNPIFDFVIRTLATLDRTIDYIGDGAIATLAPGSGVIWAGPPPACYHIMA